MDIDLDDIFLVPATKPAPAATKFRPNANRPVLRKGKCAPANAKQGTSKSLKPAAAVNKAQSVAETDAHVQEEGVSQSLNSSENVRQESILESQRPPILSSMSLDKEKDLEIPIQDPETFPGFTVVQKPVTYEEDALLIGRCSHIDRETIETEEAEVFPGLATIESFPDSISTTCIGQHRGKFIPKKMKGGLKKSSLGIQHSEAGKDHLPDILVDFKADLANEGPTPSSDESTPGGQVSQLQDSETLEDCSEPSRFDASISRESEVGDNPDVLGNSNRKNAQRDAAVEDSLQKPMKSSNGSAANEVKKSSRPLRKRGATLHHGGESDVEAQNSDCIAGEANVNANGEETLSQVKKGPRKSKTTRTKGEKPTKKRKNGDGTVPEKPSDEQEPPKNKKFTHSTQRRKRVVDKVLLQTPEEDIDYQKLCMRDLILLAEHKEKLAKKVKMPKASQGSASKKNSVDGDDSRNNESTVTPEEDEALDQAAMTDNVEPIITLFNYQSFMNKTPKIKWSKQDTELFYEGIRQFGTDLGMIKQLFPDLTRHQVKLKYKKEERQNPLRLSEAIHGRAKDHRHFELVIKRLEAANKAETESNADDDDEYEEEESNGEAKKNQHEEEEAASIPNFDTKEEKKEDEEIDHLNFETPQDQLNDDEDDDEIDEDFFSSYKTEL